MLKLYLLICKLNMEVGEIYPVSSFLHHSPGAIRLIKMYKGLVVVV